MTARMQEPRWTSVLIPWVVTQLIAGTALLAAGSFMSDDRVGFLPFTHRRDGGYYLNIASTGYGPVNVVFPRWAFFPGLPAVIRGLGDLGIDDRTRSMSSNQLALLLAMIAIHRMALRRGTPSAAPHPGFDASLIHQLSQRDCVRSRTVARGGRQRPIRRKAPMSRIDA